MLAEVNLNAERAYTQVNLNSGGAYTRVNLNAGGVIRGIYSKFLEEFLRFI